MTCLQMSQAATRVRRRRLRFRSLAACSSDGHRCALILLAAVGFVVASASAASEFSAPLRQVQTTRATQHNVAAAADTNRSLVELTQTTNIKSKFMQPALLGAVLRAPAAKPGGDTRLHLESRPTAHRVPSRKSPLSLAFLPRTNRKANKLICESNGAAQTRATLAPPPVSLRAKSAPPAAIRCSSEPDTRRPTNRQAASDTECVTSLSAAVAQRLGPKNAAARYANCRAQIQCKFSSFNLALTQFALIVGPCVFVRVRLLRGDGGGPSARKKKENISPFSSCATRGASERLREEKEKAKARRCRRRASYVRDVAEGAAAAVAFRHEFLRTETRIRANKHKMNSNSLIQLASSRRLLVQRARDWSLPNH